MGNNQSTAYSIHNNKITILNKEIDYLSIPNSVRILPIETFKNCLNLISVSIPNSVSLIDHYCFNNCQSLVWIAIPNSVAYLDLDVLKIAFRFNLSITRFNEISWFMLFLELYIFKIHHTSKIH
jgi:hypothetical protein